MPPDAYYMMQYITDVMVALVFVCLGAWSWLYCGGDWR